MTGKQENITLRSVTGLEGGLVACGSTCGVVTGGALGIALMRSKEIDDNGEEAQKNIMMETREYVEWFHRNFKTTLCRERTNADFYKASGMLGYFLPGAMGKCFWHMGKASSYMKSLSLTPLDVSGKNTAQRNSESIHCATKVLEEARKISGIGDALLEKISFVLDGGVALSGGLCGAMAGAVMAMNLVFGWDVRTMSYPKIIKEFVRGHINLLRHEISEKDETFAIGKEIMNQLRNMEPLLECSRITGRTFSDWDDFQAHIQASASCRNLITEAAAIAVQTINRNKIK
jgi:hypothetical protein